MNDPILLTLLKMRPHDSQSSRENATPFSGTSPVASYKEVPPPPPRGISVISKATRVHKAMTVANNTSLCSTILVVLLEFIPVDDRTEISHMNIPQNLSW